MGSAVDKCCCCCPDQNGNPSNPGGQPPCSDQQLGGPVSEHRVPITGGFSIPALGVFRGYNRFYTCAMYVPQDQIPGQTYQPHLTVGEAEFEFGYYENSRTIAVNSDVKTHLVFPSGVKVEVDRNRTKVYPTNVPGYYVEFIYYEDFHTGDEVEGHYDVSIHGYDHKDAQGFDLNFSIQSNNLMAPGHIQMKAPYINLSTMEVNLSSADGDARDVVLTSNVSWRIVL